MKWWADVGGAIILCLAAGCSGAAPGMGQPGAAAPNLQAATVTGVDHPSQTPNPPDPIRPATAVPQDSQRPTAVLIREAPALSTDTPQAVLTEPPLFQPCSPLVEHPLKELSEIISDPYRPPPPGREERHHGVDFSYYRRGERTSIQGAGVQAVLGGRVALALADSFPYGNIIIVETPGEVLPVDLVARIGLGDGEALYTLYAHLEEPPLAALDEQIAACQKLGAVGKSGNAGIAHLHLETRLGPAGARFERMGYYTAQASEAEKAEYLRWRIGGEFRHIDPMILLSSE